MFAVVACPHGPRNRRAPGLATSSGMFWSFRGPAACKESACPCLISFSFKPIFPVWIAKPDPFLTLGPLFRVNGPQSAPYLWLQTPRALWRANVEGPRFDHRLACAATCACASEGPAGCGAASIFAAGARRAGSPRERTARPREGFRRRAVQASSDPGPAGVLRAGPGEP